ncbi:helix-turn-helix domain-containing protein [Sphaerimonospora thailandensis]|uniref:helix-turn-helix domain-containing protein n=1 Tax=Sphaerimonospora thailandensis TaxID=795644 RepID=UPI00194E0CB6|nr:helix-turn-helix transcriptional regulator [Sphaerimonospora thailandensis]
MAIRTIRQLRKKSMKELAEAVKITPQSLSNAENETKRVSLDLLNRIAIALEIPLAAISRVPVATGQRPALQGDFVPEQETAA